MKGHLVDLAIYGDGQLGDDATVLDEAVVGAGTKVVEGTQGLAQGGRLDLDPAAAIAKRLQQGRDDDGDHGQLRKSKLERPTEGAQTAGGAGERRIDEADSHGRPSSHKQDRTVETTVRST